MRSNRKTIINLICSISVLITNVIISFFLSPYIVKHIGVEANGFVTLANNFVMYANLIVTAINSMAARFITIEYVKKNYKKANLYYNSVFWGNLIVVAVLLLPATYLIIHLENMINVTSNLVWDVKILFSFIFFNFFITTGAPNWECGTYISNRLDRQYIPNMVVSIFRCVFLFLIFAICTPHVWYVGLSASIVTVVMLAVNGYNTHKLTPELKVGIKREKQCSWKIIKELVGSGIWNSISSVGNILLSGLDLIICNVTLGATQMGILSLSKLLPNYMQQLSGAIQSAFAPELTINYATGNKKAVLEDINRAMKITSIIVTVPIAIIIIMGDKFFALWVPTQDAKLLQILSILSILGYMFTSGTQILYNVFTTVNKVKTNSVAMLLSGIISTIITLLVINFTDKGIYAVAGVSTFVNLVRNMTFTVPATAKYLGFKWYQFFPQVGMTVFSSVLLIVLGYLIKPYLFIESWIQFFGSVIVLGVIGILVNIVLILNKDERAYLFEKVRSKIRTR